MELNSHSILTRPKTYLKLSSCIRTLAGTETKKNDISIKSLRLNSANWKMCAKGSKIVPNKSRTF
jgi:hypothetical protein